MCVQHGGWPACIHALPLHGVVDPSGRHGGGEGGLGGEGGGRGEGGGKGRLSHSTKRNDVLGVHSDRQ